MEGTRNNYQNDCEVRRDHQYSLQYGDETQSTNEDTNQTIDDLKQVHKDFHGLCKALGATIMEQEKIAKKAKHNPAAMP